jgi:hypothetical protein
LGLGAGSQARRRVAFEYRHHPLGEHVSRREPQIILKTDERSIVFEPGLGGKFSAKSTAWDENRVFLEGDKLEVAVKNGDCLPAGPRQRRPRCSTTSRPKSDAVTAL